jgi:hemerythrin
MYIDPSQVKRVNVAVFDKQHQDLVQTVNKLYEIFLSQEVTQAEAVLTALENYANEHLALEEEYFEKYKYPDSESHIKIHDYYKRTIADFRRKYNPTNRSLLEEMLGFLRQWWLNHINSVDTAYTAFFNEHGVV